MSPPSIPVPFTMVITAVLTSICILSVALRFFVRWQQGARPSAGDYICLAACISTFSLAVTLIPGSPGERFSSPSQPSDFMQPSTQAFCERQAFQIPILGLAKVGVLLMYRQVLGTKAGAIFRALCRVMVVYTIGWTVVFSFASHSTCSAFVNTHWRPVALDAQKLAHTGALIEAIAITNFVFDMIILAMPIPILWQLYLTLDRRIGLAGMYLLGCFAVTTSCARLVVLNHTNRTGGNTLVSHELSCVNSVYWAMVEASLAVCAACLPTLYYFLDEDTLAGTSKAAGRDTSPRSILRKEQQDADQVRPRRNVSWSNPVDCEIQRFSPTAADFLRDKGEISARRADSVLESGQSGDWPVTRWSYYGIDIETLRG